MRYNDVVYLMAETIDYDEIGNSVKKWEETMVFANRYQVSISEFYSENINYKGAQHTSRNKKSFQIRTASYKDQPKFKYEDIVYDVIRVSDNGEFVLIVGVETIGKS